MARKTTIRGWTLDADSLPSNAVPVRAFIECLCAAHLSTYVEAPFKDVGGIMIVGPPGTLKTSMLKVVTQYPNAVESSDLNITALEELRPSITSKHIRTLVMPEYAKIYERDPRTSNNVEGQIRAMVDEGFQAPSFKPQQMARLSAHCLVLGGITEQFREEHYRRWSDTGFNRRFIWPLIRLANPEILDIAADEWKRVDFRVRYLPGLPANGRVPNLTRTSERTRIRSYLKYQPGPTHTTQSHLLTRMLAVLKWWYHLEGRPVASASTTMRLFCRTLAKEGAEVVI